MSKTNYYDFCDKNRWKFRFIWFLQSLIFRDVLFYYNERQTAYCREIKNVEGSIIDGWFYPKHFLVKYRQKIN